MSLLAVEQAETIAQANILVVVVGSARWADQQILSLAMVALDSLQPARLVVVVVALA
jgi:hypothetical protein